MTRYDRQTRLPEIGAEGQARLRASRVLVVGAGGLGSTVLPLLAGAGVGTLRVIDPDEVEESNLHRQILYRMSDLGRAKAEAAAEALTALNRECHVAPLVASLDPVLAAREIAQADLVVDGADTIAVTYALSDLCHAARIPLISASVLARSGYAGGFCGGAPSYRSIFPDLPETMPSCAGGGVMGPAVATLGALQAQMALAVLLGHEPSPLGLLLSVDLQSWRLSSFRFDTAPEPDTAAPRIVARGEIGPDDIVIELRDPREAPDLPVPHAQRMSPEDVARFEPGPDRRVVFVCATGLRAWRAARRLAARTSTPVAILAAGR
ncbi:HesA/MoeB/ThiF family protein [Kaustia mangrovi]|uniref:HesA/MoeB/ThiF family protein n=1 Tax=Kaustia mangrovi TaxID=2593653 RepID=A0A7S8HBW0_9HYPH|nr:HesA/MoeB/ThiF family protein [Kaustia mangrovi]QPC42613.1 HesA/MoeB/ThiF family protein [Kaustia mangrovi]